MATLKPDSQPPRRKGAPWLRWLSILLRSLHLAAVVAVGIACHGGTVALSMAGPAVLVSGLVLLAVEVAAGQVVLKEAAGAAALLKLLPVAAMLLWPSWQQPLFWLLVLWSSFFSHAPKDVRHHRLAGVLKD